MFPLVADRLVVYLLAVRPRDPLAARLGGLERAKIDSGSASTRLERANIASGTLERANIDSGSAPR